MAHFLVKYLRKPRQTREQMLRDMRSPQMLAFLAVVLAVAAIACLWQFFRP